MLTTLRGHTLPLNQNLLQKQKEGSSIPRNTSLLMLFPSIHQPLILERMSLEEEGKKGQPRIPFSFWYILSHE